MTVKRWVTLAIALVGWLTANEGRTGTLVQFANVPEYATPTQLLGYLRVPTDQGGSQPSSCCMVVWGFPVTPWQSRIG
jgi:hypothetical protein